MASIRVDEDHVHIELSALEKLGALRGNVSIPRAAITSVERVPNARGTVRGLRMPGTGVPGAILLGTFRSNGERTFAAAYRNDPGYRIGIDPARAGDLPYSLAVVSADADPALESVPV